MLVVAVVDGSLVLVRQYRPATDRFYLLLPAGYLDPGESPQDAARRELWEEAGLAAADCRLIGEFHPLPGYVRSAAFVVLCEASGDPHVVDGSEIDAVMKVPWSEALAMIARSEIDEMQAVAAIFLANTIVP